MRVDVTKEDIDNGQQFSAASSPVALALGRATNTPPHMWMVRMERIEYGRQGWDTYREYETPDSVWSFLFHYDGDLGVEPFAFDLDLPIEEPR